MAQGIRKGQQHPRARAEDCQGGEQQKQSVAVHDELLERWRVDAGTVALPASADKRFKCAAYVTKLDT
ncbi:hypothetical protein D3C76_1836870 [compost metagenome]